MSLMVRTVATSPLVLLLACGAAGDPQDTAGTDRPADVDRIDATDIGSPDGPQGCGDTFVYATDDENTIAVTVSWEGAAATAHETDGYEDEVQLPHPAVRVGVQRGSGLSLGCAAPS